jgi:putative FmdB family regulatory protein
MTYEYLCEACGHQWEAEQSIKDRPLDKCVSCGAAKAKRLVSGGTGFLLKGGGWYADLYSSPGTGKGDDKGSKAGASKSDSSEAKSSGDSKSSGDGKAAASSTSSNASSTSTSTSASAPAPAAASAKAS